MDALSNDRKKTGGLVLKRVELEAILKEPETQGLAFALKKPGKAPNVDLKILRVFEKGGTLHGEERSVTYKKGAPSTLRYPATSVKDYKFRYRKKLKEDAFFFGYFSKDSFEALFRHNLDEIFLGGGIKNYGDIDLIEGDKAEWFSLAISVRRSLESVIAPNGTNAASSSRAMEKHLVSFEDFSGKSKVNLETLREKIPQVFNQEFTVASLLVAEGTSQIQGMVLKTDKGLQEIEFNSKRPVGNIMLNLDGGIRRIDFWEEDEEDEKENLEPENESMELGNMYMNHIEPCPPHWYRGFNSRGGEIKTFLESIIK